MKVQWQYIGDHPAGQQSFDYYLSDYYWHIPEMPAIQYGWVCPICNTVWAPWICECRCCAGHSSVSSSADWPNLELPEKDKGGA